MSDKKNCEQVCKKTSIGGQALMGGIMMRGPQKSAMAVRNPKNEIIIEEWPTVDKPVPKIFKLPIFRGMYNMVASMAIGMKCIMRSAEISELGMEDEAEENKEENNNENNSENIVDNAEGISKENAVTEEVVENFEEKTFEKNSDAADEDKKDKKSKAKKEKKAKKDDDKITDAEWGIITVVSTILGVGLAILLFFWLPTQLFTWVVNGLIGYQNDGSYLYMVVRSAFEGVIRILLFVGYMFAVSFMKEIKMTFMYHGAEHKTIFCYEKGLPLTVENIRKQSRLHPRCGTSFMVIMLILGIVIGTFVPEFHVFEQAWLNNIIRTAIKLPLLPIIVGLGYELIKFAGRYDNLFVRMISAPGKLMQLISTKEPTDDMIECAIAAMERVIPNDESDNW